MKHVLMLSMFCLLSLATWAQSQVVTGVVKDVTGEPVISATVQIKGTITATMTDIDGKYSINAEPSATLIFSSVGFISQEILVENKKTINVTLRETALQLNEVVVVGYGQQKKESVIGAISSINSDELLKSASPNITQAMAGKIPGLITNQTSGAPGSDDMQLFIRGRASFAGDNQPLIMVDGVERSFSQIAPDDIESISVLKDASATAVYGVRGANGVILVTTKRGREQKPVVSLTANLQLQTPTCKDTYLDSYNSVTLLEEALANDGLASQFSAHDIEMYRKSSLGQLSPFEQQLYPNVDWYDQVLKSSSPSQRYNVNIQGGTRRMYYFASVEYYGQKGLFKNFNNYGYKKSSNLSFDRYSFRANMDFLLTKDLTASVNIGTRFEERKGPNIIERDDYNDVFYLLNHTPGWLFPVKYDNGLYGGNAQNQYNVVAHLAQGGFYQTTNNINETNFIVNYKMDAITKGLSAKAMVSFDYETTYDRRFNAGYATYELIDRSRPEFEDSYTRYNEDQEISYVGNIQTTIQKLYMEFALNYARTFGKHDVTALFLYNQNDYRYQAELAKRYQGVVGRATYNYDRRYFAEFNAGYNGSENFAKGRRFGFFPSFSLGWMLSNEKFMEKTNTWLDALKLRASYGEVGNDAFKDANNNDLRFLYIPSWTQLNPAYTFGDTNSQMGIYEGRYPNYLVTWERARKYNLAFESSMLNGLLAVNFDWFQERRNDILTSYLTKPSWIGVIDYAPANLGKTKNGGFELEVKHRNKIGKVNYFVNATFARAKNEILYKDEAPFMTDYRKREGHAINQYFGLICDGFITQADIDGGQLAQSSFGNTQVGDLKYRDMNDDGFIDERDETFIGYSDIPENTYSLTLGADYKGFAFSVLFQGVSNVSRYYDAEAQFAFVNGGKVKEHHFQRWNPARSEAENLANAKYPLLHYDSFGNHNQRTSSFFLKNGEFLRIKNIELSYSLPIQLIKKWYMSEMRFYVNANNLVTWDKLDGLTDPESNGSNRYPIMKTFNFGVNIKF
ncbi:TonB-dependent receptor [Dysgonomonas sp. 511]|uniref:SusC/RagA family TonB-linked outer membrane protein n=1 Tax=Dysgonomonas sp. 511 TaxID=2302930 RepID=UPI0013D5EC71|nr:TonB-dependent receptor [Dysgonomonas sp. 511]